MNSALLHPEVQKFILENLHADVHKMMLGKSPFEELSARELAEQIDSKRRAEKKLPTWFATPGIYYPPRLSIEQTSSEITAAYKSALIRGSTAIDLTGGFGVDSFYFSKVLESLVHVEQNSVLSAIAEHNLRVLGANNITFVNDDALIFLKNYRGRFDTLYIDPSRRVDSKKVFLLEDTVPNVVENLDLFFSRADRVVIKTSPMLDLQSGLKTFGHTAEEVHIVSVKNDCKELLWILSAQNKSETKIICSALGSERPMRFDFGVAEERSLQLSNYDYASPSLYLYEPDVAVAKAGAFKTLVSRYGVQKLDVSSHIYTSETLQENFPGKVFRIERWGTYKEFSKEKISGSFNVVSRNFPLPADQLKKKHKIKDGGSQFLIFTRSQNQLVTIRAERII